MREYILVSYVIYGETWLYYLGGGGGEGGYVSYLSEIPFEQIDDGCTTEWIIGMIFLLGELFS